ncbi:alpha-tectorin [Camponotus floridanus]|uniref:alpha-tectorin n=1 Tax=Camponotus floridanus TaxID=104421 RepID=UPI000DC6BACB|nr:alpha-tectorin [Camponotus floridanus]
MFRISFILLVVVGVLLSIAAAQRQCPENQEWTSCGSACPRSCNSNPEICTLQCIIGCQCKSGFVLNAKGNCVSPEQCLLSTVWGQSSTPKKKCGKNEEWTECGSVCPPKCFPPKKPQACPAMCFKGCQCKSGFLRNSHNKCVHPCECDCKPHCISKN